MPTLMLSSADERIKRLKLLYNTRLAYKSSKKKLSEKSESWYKIS